MKCFIPILIFGFMVPVLGQETPPNREMNNEVGIILSDMINGSLSFNYERALGKHISVGLIAGYKTEQGLIALSGLDTDFVKTGDISYSGTRFIPEFRYYLTEKGQGMLSGFYFGAYLKFINFTSDIDGIFISSEGENFDFLYKGNINVASLGLMVGYKLKISDRFNIDFLIAGPGASNYKFRLRNIIPPPDEFYDALNEALKEYSLFDLLNADLEFRDNKLNEKILLPEFRYGIKLSYAF
ncbi:Protein of unknown function [Muriicola jejuensis]|uniref:DUF3575 domain-containing protein n=1 Tax=Muriicola jejuensis TaxID=504488 RepID=A0A6P0U716_9FLAO|nr:DUF3575 domain-containing protein [Muriicola jejuensis]NER08915.1 DUF3575 domain-containing protein [Muriicola jejuensis]SMP12943.1 Protein of unknown function [Muriicola jejuensis]